MPNFKMTYPYTITCPPFGEVVTGEVVASEDPLNGNFFEPTTDPVGKPETEEESAATTTAPPAPPAAAAPAAIPDASSAAPAAEAATAKE